jgi:predicted transcriptional regulator of viral defense system
MLCFVKECIMEFIARSLSPQESRVVLALTEEKRREVSRTEIVSLLGSSPQAADHVIRSLQRKGWLARAAWGRYLLIPPDQGPDALGESNLLALASRIADPYYIGFSTAASHYGLTTQHRRLICLVTPKHVRGTRIQETEVRIINLGPRRFFGYVPVDAFGYQVMMSDREKTVLDCIDRPALAGGIGETAQIYATAVRRFDWQKALEYLERIGSASLVRRFGFLADHVGVELPGGIYDRLRRAADRPGVSFIGPRKAGSTVIGHQGKWRLTVNVPVAALSESAGMGKQRTISKGR